MKNVIMRMNFVAKMNNVLAHFVLKQVCKGTKGQFMPKKKPKNLG